MSARTRLRILTDEEIELWRQVAQTVAPRPGALLPQHAAPKINTIPNAAPAAEAVPPVHRPGTPSYAPPRLAPSLGLVPLAPLERQFRKGLVQGRIGIERAIDLHGLNQAEAHSALRGFLRASQADQLRLVLVVTGKGGRGVSATADAGVLRRAVPHWLREPDLRSVIVGFEEAARPHGGAGALYVRLRSRRRAEAT